MAREIKAMKKVKAVLDDAVQEEKRKTDEKLQEKLSVSESD
jgi:hypothetical protein